MTEPQIIVEPVNYGPITGSETVTPDGKPVPRTRRKVSIVGFAPSSMGDVKAVWDDPDMEVWGLNQLYMAFPLLPGKATRWFQIHHKHTAEMALRDHSHWDWLAQQVNFPIYMQEKYPEISMSIAFPVDMILKRFRRYFTNSISWEIALAIHEGFEEIHLYGIDMAQDGEFAFERPSVEYFCGYAEGAGIKLYLPGKCDICKSAWLYPFEDDAPFRAKLEGRRLELRGRMNEMAHHEQEAHDGRMQLVGALDNMNYIEQTWAKAVKALEGPAFVGK